MARRTASRTVSSPDILRRRVAARLALLGLSMRQVARDSSVSLTSIDRWLSTGVLTPKACETLGTALVVPEAWLFSTSLEDVGDGLNAVLAA